MNDQPISIQDAFELGVRHHQEGRLEEAEHIYQKILQVHPENPEALHLYGVLAYQAGKHEVATGLIGKALQIKPDFADAHNNLGNALGEQGKLDEAVASYRRAIALKSGFAEAHDNLGKALAYQGKLDEAVASYRHAIAVKPDFGEAHNNLGNTLGEQGKLDDAVVSHQRALAINPNSAEGHYNLGIALGHQGKQDEAVACYRRAVIINPDFADAHHNLGIVLGGQGKREEATVSCRRAVEIDPTNASAKHMLAALSGQTTETAPPEYVKDLFDQFSTKFDRHLVEKLEYKTPALLREALDQTRKDGARFRNAIDLGCGTGLGGMEFKAVTDRLSGIDISPKMVEMAKGKNIYDDLRVGDIIEFLNATGEKYDLITAVDVLVYFGNLQPLFQAVQTRALSGAYFVFSTESSDQGNYVLRQTGRYAHSRSCIQSLAEEHHFSVEISRSADIRRDKGQWVLGDLFVLKYTGAS